MVGETTIQPDRPVGRQVVDSYGGGRFRVSGEIMEGSVIVFPDRALPWAVNDCSKITMESLDPIVKADPAVDVLFIGCGESFCDEPAGLRQALRNAGIALEWMNTGAASRTWNIAVSDDRSIAAALISFL